MDTLRRWVGSSSQGMANKFGEFEKKLNDTNASPMSLPLEFLKNITCDFSTKSVLGQGGYGVVYKGVLQSGKIIAVKKLLSSIHLNDQMFQNEVSYLMGLNHQNIVKLLGYCAESIYEFIEMPSGSGKYVCAETPERLLCFEYVSNQSLDKHISDESSGLDWNMRYRIIKGICNGLHFLHEECHIVHLDLKPQNILMDSFMTAKIADFGLSRIFGDQQSRTFTAKPVGTLGFMAPEYLIRGVVSNKADMFSLGVIFIEIITGRRNYPDFQHDSPYNIATSLEQFTEKVLGSWRNKFESTANFILMERSTQQLRQCISIALECLDPAMEKRPTAQDIIKKLNGVDKMDANNELLSVTQCKDGLLVLNPTISNNVTPQNQSVREGLLIRETNTEVVGNAKFQEGSSLMPLSESSRANEIVKWSAKASNNLQEASDATIETIPHLIEIIPMEICEQRVVSLDVCLTKPWIVMGHDSGYVDMFDYEKQRTIGSDNGHQYFEFDATAIKFIERKQWFIVGSLSGHITVYTYETRVEKITRFRAKNRYFYPIDSLAIHPSQPYVLSSSFGYIQLWDWDKNWQCIRTFEKQWGVLFEYGLTFNPNDTNEFASVESKKIKIWNLDSPKFNYTLHGHSDDVKCLDFFTHDDNQQYLITGSSDKTAKIWDMQKRTCVRTLRGFMSPVFFVVSCPFHSILITATKDGAILLWSATNFRLMRSLNNCGPGYAYNLACLTGLGRLVLGNKSTLFMVDILDAEPADAPAGNEEP